ncbi:MAG: AMP-binding protein [Nitriliruptorales bacterium]|nr:AMP-binding protein [Nitriliruptorales bacterium]
MPIGLPVRLVRRHNRVTLPWLSGNEGVVATQSGTISAMTTTLPPSVASLLQRRVLESGSQPFLTFYDDLTGERTELSHATFENWTSKTANLLVEELDAQPGDQVALALSTHWTTAVIAFACWQIGACAVVMDPGEAPVAPTGARAVFVEEAEVTRGAAPRGGQPVAVVGAGMGGRLVDGPPAGAGSGWLAYGEEVLAFPDDYDGPGAVLDGDALLVTATGGAAVRLTQRNVLAAADALAAWGLAPGARLLVTRPPQFVDGLVLGLLGPYLAGGSVVLVGNLDPATFWRKAADERATGALVDATMLDALPAPEPAHDMRHLLCPAGAAPAIAERATERVGVSVHVGHGLVAATSASSLVPAETGPEVREWLAGMTSPTVGPATSRAEMAVTGPDGTPVRQGARGEIQVRGDVVSPDAGEWLHSGDEGFIQAAPDGREWAFLTGRIT